MRISVPSFGTAARWAVFVGGLAFGALALAQALVISGAAVVTDLTGIVRYQIGNEPSQVATRRRALPAGAIVTTGEDASVVLAFADGQIIVLGERTRFRIVGYAYDPKELGKSGVSLNLIEGSARLVMGAIGQFDPRLIRIQVGTGTVAGVPDPAGAGRGADAGISVQGATTLLEVTQGRVALTLISGQSFQVGAGEGALVQPDGSVLRGSIPQIEAQASLSSVGKLMVSRIDELESYAFPQRNQQTIIALATPSTMQNGAPPTAVGQEAAKPAATPPADTTAQAPAPPAVDVGVQPLPPPAEPPPALNLPPLQTGSSGGGATGAGGGGLPCGASCN